MAPPSDRPGDQAVGEDPHGIAPTRQPGHDEHFSAPEHPAGLLGIEVGGEFADRYLLEEKLATGRASTVWRTRDRSLERAVAIKVLHLPEALDAEAVDNFKREARAVAQLAHGNIVRLFDAGVANGLHYLAMEYLRGGSLNEALELHRPDADTLAALAYQAADALAATHEAGFAHRDVKPSNILLTERGVVKLSDFGIVRNLRRSTTIRSKDTVLGTARYLAPEQVEGERATPASDVYSLALVLWEAWTGQSAFRRETTAATALARLRESLPRASELRPGLPDELDGVIATAISQDPDERFATGAGMRDVLQELVGSRPEQATAVLVSPAEADEPGSPGTQ